MSVISRTSRTLVVLGGVAGRSVPRHARRLIEKLLYHVRLGPDLRPPLVCRPCPDQAGYFEWCTAGTVAMPPVHRGSPEELAAAVQGRPWLAVFPAEQATLLRAAVKTRRWRAASRAAPYAIEEKLAGDVDGLHVAIGQQSTDAGWPVAALAPRDLQAFVDQFGCYGLHPRHAVPDLLCVPWAETEWTLGIDDGRILLRLGPWEGCALPQASLTEYLAVLVNPAGKAPSRVRLVGGSPQDRHAVAGLMEQHGIAVVAEPGAADLLPWLAQNTGNRINLLQGRFAPPRAGVSRGALAFFAATVALAATIILATTAAEKRFLELRRDALTAEVATALRTAFPQERRVVNPRAQMTAGLDELRERARLSQQGLLALLGEIAPALGIDNRIVIETLEYRQGRIEIQVQAPNLQTLEELRTRLGASPDLIVTITSVEAGRADRAAGRILIQAKDS